MGVDGGGRHAHAGTLHRDPYALVGAGEAEHAAYLGVTDRVLQEGFGDPLGSHRVSGQQDPLGDVARLSADVHAHPSFFSLIVPPRRGRFRRAGLVSIAVLCRSVVLAVLAALAVLVVLAVLA